MKPRIAVKATNPNPTETVLFFSSLVPIYPAEKPPMSQTGKAYAHSSRPSDHNTRTNTKMLGIVLPTRPLI
ncbi:MAG TPA: hypothetical protein VK833_03985 [Gillisia sp.]|nr:hypothetical protein [Gillisia sp.]